VMLLVSIVACSSQWRGARTSCVPRDHRAYLVIALVFASDWRGGWGPLYLAFHPISSFETTTTRTSNHAQSGTSLRGDETGEDRLLWPGSTMRSTLGSTRSSHGVRQGVSSAKSLWMSTQRCWARAPNAPNSRSTSPSLAWARARHWRDEPPVGFKAGTREDAKVSFHSSNCGRFPGST
jgi:hypothetical protein